MSKLNPEFSDFPVAMVSWLAEQHFDYDDQTGKYVRVAKRPVPGSNDLVEVVQCAVEFQSSGPINPKDKV